LETQNIVGYAAEHLNNADEMTYSVGMVTMSSVIVFFLVLPSFLTYPATPPPFYFPPSLPFTLSAACVAETANVNRPELGSNA
jgi:hypothetical protein